MKLILIIILLFAVTGINAQSFNADDYTKIYKEDDRYYLVDITSFETLKNGNTAFWGMSPNGNNFDFTFLEADCRLNRLGLKAVTVVLANGQSSSTTVPLLWMPKKDRVSVAYLRYVCR